VLCAHRGDAERVAGKKIGCVGDAEPDVGWHRDGWRNWGRWLEVAIPCPDSRHVSRLPFSYIRYDNDVRYSNHDEASAEEVLEDVHSLRTMMIDVGTGERRIQTSRRVHTATKQVIEEPPGTWYQRPERLQFALGLVRLLEGQGLSTINPARVCELPVQVGAVGAGTNICRG